MIPSVIFFEYAANKSVVGSTEITDAANNCGTSMFWYPCNNASATGKVRIDSDDVRMNG